MQAQMQHAANHSDVMIRVMLGQQNATLETARLFAATSPNPARRFSSRYTLESSPDENKSDSDDDKVEIVDAPDKNVTVLELDDDEVGVPPVTKNSNWSKLS